MTDRIKGLLVHFDKDYREDDIEDIITVIKCLKGVIKVEKSASNYDDILNKERIRNELSEKLYSVLHSTN